MPRSEAEISFSQRTVELASSASTSTVPTETATPRHSECHKTSDNSLLKKSQGALAIGSDVEMTPLGDIPTMNPLVLNEPGLQDVFMTDVIVEPTPISLRVCDEQELNSQPGLQDVFKGDVIIEPTPVSLRVCNEQELITPVNSDSGVIPCRWHEFIRQTDIVFQGTEVPAGRDLIESESNENAAECLEGLEGSQEAAAAAAQSQEAEEESHTQTDSPPNQSPLHPNSDLTLNDSLIAVLSYASSCRLSGVDFCKLLDLLHLLLPKPNNLPTSHHLFFNQFRTEQKELQIYYYCATCWKRRSTGHDKCDVCPKSRISFYITCSIVDQLTAILQRPGMREKLNHKNVRTKTNVHNIEDVYDSEIYKQAEQSFLVNGTNISLTWYTDGVALFESGEYSLWPFVFVINELPLQERFKIENLIIGGIWGDKCKPHPNVFTLPIYKEVCVLKTGFKVVFHGSDGTTIVKAIVLFGVCDTPAKATFLNLKGHAGYCSCPKCYIKGEKSKRTGNVMVFPHQEVLEYRDIQSYNDLVRLSVADPDSKMQKGVNGPTVLSYMMYSSIFSGVSIDSMHSLHLGVTKQILTLLFDSKYSDEPFSLSAVADEINDRLRVLDLPHFVERLFEDVTKLSHWKASLCRNFLEFFMLPILQDKMPEPQFKNLELLVKGVSLLNQQSISVDDVNEADEILKQFCCDFQNIYGLRHMSSNIHLLRHLARSVLETGPLFVTSAYKFEDINGKMASLVHGTTQASKQIFNNMSVASKLPLLIESVQCSAVQSYCKKLTRGSSQLPFSEQISPGLFVVGTLDVILQHARSINELLPVLFQKPVQFRTFSRLYKNGMLFVSSSYGKGSRVSCFCKYNIPHGTAHGKILTFVKTTNTTPGKYFALISRSDGIPCELYRYSVYSDAHNSVDLTPVEQLLNVSFCIPNRSGFPLLIDPLNSFELE